MQVSSSRPAMASAHPKGTAELLPLQSLKAENKSQNQSVA